jgi:hypothetical protein
MPQYGTLDPAAQADLPVVGRLAADAWTTQGCEVLNLAYELDDTHDLALIPPALHPAIPLYGTLMLRTHPESPVGSFALAELRVMTRAGIHYGGFTVGVIASTRDAVDFLRDGYGYPATLGEVQIDRRHYATLGRVRCDGGLALEAALEHAEPIAPSDVLYTNSFNLALVGGEPTIVQAEPAYTPERAERGSPRVEFFDAAAFGDARIKLTTPLPATYASGSLEMRPVRWLMDPKVPAVMGARKL